jgi:hypothetical protein
VRQAFSREVEFHCSVLLLYVVPSRHRVYWLHRFSIGATIWLIVDVHHACEAQPSSTPRVYGNHPPCHRRFNSSHSQNVPATGEMMRTKTTRPPRNAPMLPLLLDILEEYRSVHQMHRV